MAWIISYFQMKAKMNLTTVTNAINDSSSSQKRASLEIIISCKSINFFCTMCYTFVDNPWWWLIENALESDVYPLSFYPR